jgi:hypothetical protein
MVVSDPFLGADLANDDAVGPHTEGVDHQLADVNGALALDVGRAGFHARHVGLLQPQLGRILDGHDALVLGNVAGERIEQRRLSGAGSAADQDVEARLHAALQQFQHSFGERQPGDQVLALHPMAAETADAKQRSIDGYGRDGGVDARAIRQAGVHQRRTLIDAAPHAGHHFLDDAQQVGVVLELDRRTIQLAGPLHVYQLGSGDQNIADGRILQQWLEGSQSEDFVQNLFDDAVFLDQAEWRLLFIHQLCHGHADLRPHAVARHR